MTLEEAKKRADAGDLNSCRLLVEYYTTEEHRPQNALPYSEKLALAGDEKYFGITASIYNIEGYAYLGIGAPTEEALEKYEKALEWAVKSQDESLIVGAKQGVGECDFKLGIKYKKTDEALAEKYYVNAYNTLVDTLGKSQYKLWDLIWALSADELQERGFNIPDDAKSRKWSVLADSFNNREVIKKESDRSEGYLMLGVSALGFAFLDGKELQRNDTAAFNIFSAAHQELDTDLSDLLSQFVRNADGTYTYNG